jgi:hypothetical protein
LRFSRRLRAKPLSTKKADTLPSRYTKCAGPSADAGATMPGLRLVTAASVTAAAGLDGDASPGKAFPHSPVTGPPDDSRPSACCVFATSPAGKLPAASPC